MSYLKSRFKGYCHECKDTIYVGQLIFSTKYFNKTKGRELTGWIHADCYNTKKERYIRTGGDIPELISRKKLK